MWDRPVSVRRPGGQSYGNDGPGDDGASGSPRDSLGHHLSVVLRREATAREGPPSRWKAGPVTVTWLPFELNPTMPAGGLDRRGYRAQKFGSWERSRQLDA